LDSLKSRNNGSGLRKKRRKIWDFFEARFSADTIMKIAAIMFTFFATALIAIKVFQNTLEFIDPSRIIIHDKFLDNESLLALIATLVAFAGLLAYIFHHVVKKALSDEIKKFADDERTASKAESYFIGGISLIANYLTAKNEYLFSSAKRTLRSAMASSEKLDDVKHFELKYWIKNNLAFVLAAHGDQADSEEAFKLVEELQQKLRRSSPDLYDDYEADRYIWNATWVLVVFRFCDEENDPAYFREARLMLRAILNDTDTKHAGLEKRLKSTWCYIYGEESFDKILKKLKVPPLN